MAIPASVSPRHRWLLPLLVGLGVGSGVAGPVLSEFMAENASTLTDEDGDHPDWIEITNPDPVAAPLEGWRLTDNPALPGKWVFPAGASIPPGGRLVVFASSKNRINPGAALHTNFTLKKEGEYLALLPPEGTDGATVFAPVFPPQREDVSYGTGIAPLTVPLVAEGAAARVWISGGALPADWTGAAAHEPFADSLWMEGTTRCGYDDLTADAGGRLLGYWNFDDQSLPGLARDSSGNNRHGTLTGPAAVTPLGGGRSGAGTDRAMDFGPGNNGASVRIDAAATGAFDAAQAADRLTVAFWAYGGAPLPAAHAVFWAAMESGTGDRRAAMAHLPWTDQVIYWDTSGCCGPETRIARLETNPARWRGQWNHYAFVKDGPKKEIWQNGVLWHSGGGALPLPVIRGFWWGSAGNASISYPGKLDECAIWASALNGAEIAGLAAGQLPAAVGSYRPLITTDLQAGMQDVTASALLRVPFSLPSGPRPGALSLEIRFDDGFIAYLNGTEIARRNAPVTASRAKADAFVPEVLDVSMAAGLLRPGPNLLALHGMNDQPGGSNFLLTAALDGGAFLPGRFFPVPTPGRVNPAGVSSFVAEIAVSPERGFFDGAVPVTVTCATPGATLRYTLDGTAPAPGTGTAVAAPDAATPPAVTLTVNATTVIRALAVHPDMAPSDVETHTYLLTNQVAAQPARPEGYPATWGVYGNYGPTPGAPVTADYQMDPEVTSSTAPGYGVREALLSLPALCLSLKPADMFDAVAGLYPNSSTQGDQWVRPAAAELIHPDGTRGFRIHAGLRIHGGLSRQHWHAIKHSFRLGFSREFGPSRLEHRLFRDTRVTSFNELTLRASSTDGWAVENASPWTRPKATYLRDVWMKDTQQTMGWPCGHSRYVNVFINGLYWGQYNLAERTEAVWQAENEGGAPEDYDIIKDVGELESGGRADWNAMIAMATAGLAADAAYHRIQGRHPDGTPNPAFPVYLNVDSLIDYMILHIYSGAIDWPNHNWWAARRRGPLSEGFRFFTWDQEISNISTTWTHTYPNEPFAEVSGPVDSPAYLYARLRANAAFRARFAARVAALTTGDGILTPVQNRARWERRAAEIDHSMVAESARWGDSRQATPLKRSDWLAELNWMRTVYWPQIHAIAVSRFRNAGLYPAAVTGVITPAAPADRVVISEIHYHPYGNPDEEFIELLNTSAAQPVMLGGARLSGAVDFSWPNAAIMPPGSRAVLVRHRAAFEARYGTGLPVLGEYQGQLPNDGGWLHLLSPAGAPWSSFRYHDAPPWPAPPDGADRSLTLRGPGQRPDPAMAAHWRPSALPGGSPGWDDAPAFPADPSSDADHDGLSALTEYFLGSSDNDAASGPGHLLKISAGPAPDMLSAQFTRALAADAVEFAWESSPDLTAWLPVPMPPAASALAGPLELRQWSWNVPAGSPPVFWRLRMMPK